MAKRFCQIVDVRFDPGTKKELRANLIERLNAIGAGLGQLLGVVFGHETPRFLSWKNGEFQWRADCWVIKPGNITWDQVYTSVNKIKAVPYDSFSDEHADLMMRASAANSGGNRVSEVMALISKLASQSNDLGQQRLALIQRIAGWKPGMSSSLEDLSSEAATLLDPQTF